MWKREKQRDSLLDYRYYISDLGEGSCLFFLLRKRKEYKEWKLPIWEGFPVLLWLGHFKNIFSRKNSN